MMRSPWQLLDEGELVNALILIWRCCKCELLTSYRSENPHRDATESDEHKVRIREKVALLIDHWRGAGINYGEESTRILAVYELEDGVRKLISDISEPID